MNPVSTLLIAILLNTNFQIETWGFFAHQKINRMAVFTLPIDLFGFYKSNIDYLGIHAVDPDKRRYALRNEFARHYIDIDHWDTIPFPNIPREFDEACLKFGRLRMYNNEDTIDLIINEDLKMDFFNECLFDYRYDVIINLESNCAINYIQNKGLDTIDRIYIFENNLVKYGILPYFLESFYKRLIWAFKKRSKKAILKISADIGHYIADAHVPLHTTINYNGQLTDQIGLHAFWESRLPELFADSEYDYLVGKADYIENVQEWIWQIVIESHDLLDELLEKERILCKSFPRNKQFCFENRLGRLVEIQCLEYSKAYHHALNGMVERRMRDAIHNIGSIWYSAWVEAGQPVMDFDDELETAKIDSLQSVSLERAYENGSIFGRKHK